MPRRILIAAWALLAGLGGLAPVAAAPFASGRIVILNGVPGDLESERTYTRQTLDALAALTAAGIPPGSVYLLVHDPATFPLPEEWKDAQLRPATREQLLALGAELGRSADPVRVLAWGHGGKVRGEPVFHVAGPRLAPADWRAFADQAQTAAAPLSAVLFFPGSGAAAAELAGPERERFASENRVPFTADPIGMDEFLKEWSRQPGASLQVLAEAAGPRIAEWYESRRLARMEEPTWFAGAEAPVQLANGEAAPVAPVEAAADSWKITPVDPADYPGQPAVVLSRVQTYTLGANPAIQAETEEFIQILTAEGKRFGDFNLEFNPPHEDLEFGRLEVRGADGQTRAFDPAKVLDAADEEGGGVKRFSLPGIGPGSILRVQTRRTWKRFPFPYVFLDLPVQDELPVKFSRIRVAVPQRETLHAHFSNGLPPVEPVKGKTAYARTFEWTWPELPPLAAEILAPPEGAPSLQLSTFPDWKTFADWYRRLIREADQITDPIRARAAELTAGHSTAEAKVKALYEYVTAMRYVLIPLGVNSHRPRSADQVLANHFGDCKDKANLLNTLARAAGFEADLVLVPRFGQADEAVPGLSFNHAISRLRLPNGRTLWLDATDDVCPFGMLPPGDSGRKVLVVDANAAGLDQLPRPDPEAHRLDIQITPARDGQSAFRFSATGFPGYAFREAARDAAPTAGTLPLPTAAGFTPLAGRWVFSETSHSPPDQLDGPFEWRGLGRWAGPAGAPPFFLPAEWSEALQPRTRPLFLNQGYPLTLRQTARIPAPEAPLPPGSGSGPGPLEWKVAWRAEGTEWIGTFDLTLRDPELAGPAVEAFQVQLTELFRQLGSPLTR